MCTFFVMSGYLCAIQPLQLMRAGKPDKARSLIASKAFRRYLCLGIPATVATFISWFMAQIGAFKLSTSLPGDVWLHFHSGYQSRTWRLAFRRLYRAIVQSSAALLIVVPYSYVRWGNMEHWEKLLRGHSMDYGSFSTWLDDGFSHARGNGIFHACLSSGNVFDSHLLCDLVRRPFGRNSLLHRNTAGRSLYFPQFQGRFGVGKPNTTPEFPQGLANPNFGFRPFSCLLPSE